MALLDQRTEPLTSHPPRRVARLRAAIQAMEDALVARTVRGARGLAQSLGVGDSASLEHSSGGEAPPASYTRVLRWVFARGGDRVTCELALSNDDACYELRMLATARGPQSLERFTDATAAFDRQSAIEGTLVGEGWSLDSYESLVTERTIDDLEMNL